MKPAKLKPCPFCGDVEPYVAGWAITTDVSVSCAHCGANIQVDRYKTQRANIRHAIKLWNTRSKAVAG